MVAQAGSLPDWGASSSYPWWKPTLLIGYHAAAALIVFGFIFWIQPLWTVRLIWVTFICVQFVRMFNGPRGPFGYMARFEELSGEDEARVRSLIEGLANDHGIQAPKPYVLPEGPPNALMFRRRGPAIGFTRSMLERYSRTELEAVIAHCLVRQAAPHYRFALLAAWRPTTRLAPSVGYEDDVRAAALTRYPPGLARAIEMAAPVTSNFAPLWFVADGSTHRPGDERVAALTDL